MNESWESEHLYFDGDEYFRALLAAIDAARTTIDLEMYIFAPDSTGRSVENALLRAAQRGVRVRLLIDGIGSLNWIANWPRHLREHGVEIRIWSPLYVGPFVRDVIRNFIRGRLSRFFAHTNRRSHRKYSVIDGKRAFVGSQNVTNSHLRRFMGAKAWRDTGIEVTGPEVSKLSQAFNHGWDRSFTLSGFRRWLGRRRFPKLTNDSLVRLNFSRRSRRRFRKDLLSRIRSATQRVWITNAYLVPTGSLLKALSVACSRGADVRILVPSRSDVFFMPWVATSFYGVLLHAGARVFEYQPSFLHAKTILIDDWAMVGTSNMNTRSFLHDLEVDIVLTGRETKDQLEAQYMADLKDAREIDLEALRSKRWVRTLGRGVSLLLRYWL